MPRSATIVQALLFNRRAAVLGHTLTVEVAMKFRKISVAVLCVFMTAGAANHALANGNNDYVPFNPPPPRSQQNQYPTNQAVQPVQSTPYYAPAQVAQTIQGRMGTVEGASAVVDQQSNTTGSGAVVGAILGGLFGRGISSGTTAGRNASTVVGAVAGGLIGNQVERNTRGDQRVTGYRLNVRFDDGTLRTIDHPVAFASGTRVVLERGSLRLAYSSDTSNTYYQPSTAPDDNSAYSSGAAPKYKARTNTNNPARTTGLEG